MKSIVEPDLQIVNRDELIERMMGSVQMAERMLQKFLHVSETECDTLESMVRRGNTREVASLAHRHKGTARTMSAERIARVAAELEQRARTDSTTELLDLVDQIRVTHRELEKVVRTEFAADKSSEEAATDAR